MILLPLIGSFVLGAMSAPLPWIALAVLLTALFAAFTHEGTRSEFAARLSLQRKPASALLYLLSATAFGCLIYALPCVGLYYLGYWLLS